MLTITGFARDEGTVILLTATDEEGNEVTVAADRRAALDILNALAVEEEVLVDPPAWAILGC